MPVVINASLSAVRPPRWPVVVAGSSGHGVDGVAMGDTGGVARGGATGAGLFGGGALTSGRHGRI
ncbi:hypothetical protein HC891_20725 [Candidatus Gracilibacteria bacterium]|nr:hypothetical protein [Candidatus Gracilibacteria bacterium]